MLLAGCTSDTDRAVRLPAPETIQVQAGFEITTVFEGLVGPTQAVVAPDGRLLVAQINGGENDNLGQVVAIDLTAATPASYETLVSELDKPTGIAIVDDALWIMERRRLTVGPLDQPATRTVVIDELPWNGRSEGTLTTTPAGALLYNTSGSKRGAQRVEGSGSVFRINNASLGGFPYSSELVATGFKHAYARAITDDGVTFATEMSDGQFDDRRALDEVVVIADGDDGGWPFCVDNNRVVAEFADNASACDGVRPSHALFSAGATPTSIANAPWNADVLVVALWIPGLVVTVPVAQPGANPWSPTTLISGIESPQYLLPSGDSLLIFDHESGAVFELRPAV